VTPPPGEVPYDYVSARDGIQHVWYKQATDRYIFLLQLASQTALNETAKKFRTTVPFYYNTSNSTHGWRVETKETVVADGWAKLEDFTPRGERASLEVFVNHFAEGETLEYDRNVFAPILDQLGVPSTSETRRCLKDADVTDDNVLATIVEMTLRYKVVHILLRTHGMCWADGARKNSYWHALAMHGEGKRMEIKTLFSTLRGTPAHVVLLLDVCGIETGSAHKDEDASLVELHPRGYERLSIISASRARGTTSGNILLDALCEMLVKMVVTRSGRNKSRLRAAADELEAQAIATWLKVVPPVIQTLTDETPLAEMVGVIQDTLDVLRTKSQAIPSPRGQSITCVSTLSAWMRCFHDTRQPWCRGVGVARLHPPRPHTEGIENAVHDVWRNEINKKRALPKWRLSKACVKDIRVFRTVFGLPARSAN